MKFDQAKIMQSPFLQITARSGSACTTRYLAEDTTDNNNSAEAHPCRLLGRRVDRVDQLLGAQVAQKVVQEVLHQQQHLCKMFEDMPLGPRMHKPSR